MLPKNRPTQIKWLMVIGTSILLLTQPLLSTAQIAGLLDSAQKAVPQPYIRYQEPEFLTYAELKRLSSDPKPMGETKRKLERLWVTPIISNEAFYQGVKPIRPATPLLGPYLRAASWNIEKSLNIDKTIRLLTSRLDFEQMIDPSVAKKGSAEYQDIIRQRERLVLADIFVLQEMEIGIKRSGYKNAAAELAEVLNMNYAYGTQYLEVDPVTLGVEKIELEEGGIDQEAMDYYAVDPAQYKGVFGSAVLSRYPIKYAELRPLKHQAYDWYEEEKKQIGFLEQARRFGTKTVFKNEITREIKVGGRHYFRVDLEVPGIPGNTLTVINVHLEIKCLPKGREAQIKEILSYIKEIKNPVIVLGDFNAAPTDISPTTIMRTAKRTAKNPTTWLNLAVNAVSPHGLALNTTRAASNITKNLNDPFARDIKVVAPNPLKDMFMTLKKYQFKDGYTFDFRGDANRSIGNKAEILANSNQRGTKGFKTTFSVKRALGFVGKYRLDWVFVKSQNKTPEDKFWPYKFSPHFGETLEEMNTSLKEPISDHHPNVVDLPFEEPHLS